jgi:transposase
MALLQNDTRPRMRTRRAIVAALLEAPDSSNACWARAAGTRKAVAELFLNRWRDKGLRSILEWGRPATLGKEQIEALGKQIRSGRLRSDDDVRKWVSKRVLRSTTDAISHATARFYARQADASWEPASAARRHKWLGLDVCELEKCSPELKERVEPLLWLCRDGKPIREVSRVAGINESTLRTQLRRFSQAGLAGLGIGRQQIKKEFFAWCDSFMETQKRVPTFEEGQQYLCSSGVKRKPRTIFNYLYLWKISRRLQAPWQQRKKTIPSDGIAAWMR